MSPRFCYVILCHTRADAVARLVRRIRRLSPDAGVLVRFGPEADVDPAILRESGADVLASAIATDWGDWSLVEAELEAYRFAQARFDADYYVLVSGQDYPVRELARWETHVTSLGADAILGLHDPNPDTVMLRWRVMRGPALHPLLRRAAVAVAWQVSRREPARLRVMESPRPGDRRWWVGTRRPAGASIPPVHKASQWKVLGRRAVRVLLEHRESDVAFFRSCRVPDELYVPSVLVADPTARVAEDQVTFVDFTPTSPSPAWLTLDHLGAVREAGTPFARKLHPDASSALVAALDALATGS